MANIYNIKTGQVDKNLSDKPEDGNLLTRRGRWALTVGLMAVAGIGGGVAAATSSNNAPKVIGHEQVTTTVDPNETMSGIAVGIADKLHSEGYSDSAATVENNLTVSTPGEGVESNPDEISQGDLVTGSIPLTKSQAK